MKINVQNKKSMN